MHFKTEQALSEEERIGYQAGWINDDKRYRELLEYVNLKLSASGLPIFGEQKDYPFLNLGESLLANLREKSRLLIDHLCPSDQTIHSFLEAYLGDALPANHGPLVPVNPLILDRHGIARMLSLPPDKDFFETDIIKSYRTHKGVCHNPAADRRTTKGVFHVVEGGYPVPQDKKEVPKAVFARLLLSAIRPPDKLMELPFTSSQERKAKAIVSLLLRPVVCPASPCGDPERSMEIRFFAPGSLVCNLDFVESIFGNAGDPYLPVNDARLDVDHWSGHTGCVILAPHVRTLTKKELGLPTKSEATPRQIRDGMYWSSEDELYNDGQAFKVCCRDNRGVIVTIISDNYFGYCKKEVKTQLSYAANLFGQCEEEHAGGAQVFPSYDLGESCTVGEYVREHDHTFTEMIERNEPFMNLQQGGYAIDKKYPDIYYIPEDSKIDLPTQDITWNNEQGEQHLKLQPGITYMLPSGYRVAMVNHPGGLRWRLIGTRPEGTLCHKPCTVSGGGKSEISKPLTDMMLTGSVLVPNFTENFAQALEIINRDYYNRYQNPRDPNKPSRPLLSPERSLGSVVKLLSPNPDYTEEYNKWVRSIPGDVRDLVLTIKRYYRPHWEEDWYRRFTVDLINGLPGHELRYKKQKVVTRFLRVGFDEEESWRIFSVRKDFWPARKVQTEDDISASIVVPARLLNKSLGTTNALSHKFVHNCEYRLFQRPDEAIVRGHDKTAEEDFSRPGGFFSNYEPLNKDQAREIVDDAIMFDKFSAPMKLTMESFIDNDSAPDYVVSTAFPRIVDGKPTKNPRYLQTRPDLGYLRGKYISRMGDRLLRRLSSSEKVAFPVHANLPGRRNNPPQPEYGIRPLAVYNPIHYQELPELFMDYIASLTGKSPSTTGAGSEGALTKGPFNALPATIDLNNALVSSLLTGLGGFSSVAGYVGHRYHVEHDISLLVPEIWSRMQPKERDPKYMIDHGLLEKVEDFEYEGKLILGSRLGYRITERFVVEFFGRIFSAPSSVLADDMLRPELQSMEFFVDGINNIVETQQRVAMSYIEDGTVELACPPLKALLNIMSYGTWEGYSASDPQFREMFTLDYLLNSEWYKDRLRARHRIDLDFKKRQLGYLEGFKSKTVNLSTIESPTLDERIDSLRVQLKKLESCKPTEEFLGFLGADPAVLRQVY